ncbi:hypothetical protein F5X68DRAFT_231115 [Plectosphaerella plurivora]|uniref:ABM domain-containing protein n=1 Tax=Plectosphaerella plurivora TaxID=936078 RepID=A0A9P8VC06_9PEZI|nr:hypothetical protein F5X68DRAFT_231115 [Plectosphaerella plurivora]
MAGPQITEMVQNPLAVSFPDFLRVFGEKMEPILLAQPGMLSIVTGVVVAPNGQHEPVAVSLTQWASLEAHDAFLKSPSAGPFFEVAKTLLTGPPTINHYKIGEVAPGSLRSRYSRIIKASALDGRKLSDGATGNFGHCVERPEQMAMVLFGDALHSVEGASDIFEGVLEAFTVEWHIHHSNESVSRL